MTLNWKPNILNLTGNAEFIIIGKAAADQKLNQNIELIEIEMYT